jgi:hypothetical protein
MHLDMSLSQFATKELQIGTVGYLYNQVSCDTGLGDQVGCFESRVLGLGPQVGYVIPLGNMQAYLNLKAYREFDSAHRAPGWNGWVTFVLSPRSTDARRTPTHR